MEWTAHFSIVIVVMLCSCIDDSFTSYCVTELSPEQRATVQELDTQQRREQRAGVLSLLLALGMHKAIVFRFYYTDV